MLKKIFSFILLLTVVLPAAAQNFVLLDDVEKSAALAKIQSAAQAMNSMSCNFVQEKTSPLLAEPSVSKGKMYYRNDSRLRWEYTSPFATAVVLNGKKMAFVGADGKTASLSGGMSFLFRNIAQVMMNGIGGQGLRDDKHFSINVLSNKQKIKVQMIPQQAQAQRAFKEIAIVFGASDCTAEQVILLDAQGGNTTITLSEKIFNQPIAEKLFAVE